MELLAKLSLPELLALQWANNITRYFLIAGMSYLVFWKWGFNFFKDRFLYPQMPKDQDIRREIKFSVLSTMIFLLPTMIVVLTKDYGWSKVYLDINEKSMKWYAASYVLMFFLHDTYFYWTHRLMHTKLLFKYFHRTHHLSVNPTPLAALAFHPLEAITEAGLFLIAPMIFPLHWSVLALFTLFSLFMNVYGHLGFNLIKPERIRKFPFNLFGHSTHHSWHHRFHNGNYGFYLQMWDRMMGTWRGELPVKDLADSEKSRPAKRAA